MLVAADPSPGTNGEEDKVASILGSHEFEGCTFKVERGDYSGILKKVVENLEKAKVHLYIMISTYFTVTAVVIRGAGTYTGSSS